MDNRTNDIDKGHEGPGTAMLKPKESKFLPQSMP
jgi:hypothetical protein